MPQKISSDPVSDNPFYQSDDWLVISYERRTALGLDTEFNTTPETARADIYVYKKGKRVEVDKRKRPIRLIFRGELGIQDFPHKNAAAKYLGIDPSTFIYWEKNGTYIKSRVWPDQLMCFRFI